MGKYEQLDQQLFAWLRDNQGVFTTAMAIQALYVESTPPPPTIVRHISQRFTQLENKRILQCTLFGTQRMCTLVGELPDTLTKARWKPPTSNTTPVVTATQSIPATTTEEFLAAGGVIQELPCQIGEPGGTNPIGQFTLGDQLFALD